MEEHISIRGAREHNLQNIDVDIPRNKVVIITGVSGSGKSTLAFDTVYAEGQRRYVESLSAYARQFLGLMEKPDVDHISGLSPAISIDQKGVSKNPRSSVGTVTEIYDYLRLLFARIGVPHCVKCGEVVQKRTPQQIVDILHSINSGERFMLLAPVATHAKGTHVDTLKMATQAGFTRIRVDGTVYEIEDVPTLDKNKWHNLAIVVDRFVADGSIKKDRLSESVETALKVSKGTVVMSKVTTKGGTFEDTIYSENFACNKCDISIHELEPRNFSFNTPYGACADCTGLGFRLEVDKELVVLDEDMSISEGVIAPWSSPTGISPVYQSYLGSLVEAHGLDLDIPYRQIDKKLKDILLHGSKGREYTLRHRTKRGHLYEWQRSFEGVLPSLNRRYAETMSEDSKQKIERYMTKKRCDSCKGQRLKAEILAVKIREQNIMQVCDRTIHGAKDWLSSLEKTFSEREAIIGKQIGKEISARLEFLRAVGLDYLTLSRSAATLSGGESQRIRLATQIGSGLTGVLYVCDEPSIGLHPADSKRLIETLRKLCDRGNSVLVVEHDEEVMRTADHIVDLGPMAGSHGGYVVGEGTLEEIKRNKKSLTGDYLSGRKKITFPKKRRKRKTKSIKVVGASENNLKSINVKIPLERLVCVSGVSGSGKSTLINEVLAKAIGRSLYRSKPKPGKYEKIEGIKNVAKLVVVDQAPIGRTPRSNPATYTGLFTPVRELFAKLPEAKARGYSPGRFSFNVKGGRCENCSGAGHTQVEMQFLPDVTVPCEECRGARYNREALELKYKNHTISDVLDMTAQDALSLFANVPVIKNKLETLVDVGLGYVKLGQPATTLSGGEAQRIKLATELSKKSSLDTVYILDEPTTGLSFYDCDKLIKVLHRLVDNGNTVVVIEHHLDILKNADWIVDLGPKAGHEGGRIVAEGTPEDIVKNNSSLTGHYLKSYLSN